MADVSSDQRDFGQMLRNWWCEQRREKSFTATTSLLLTNVFTFMRESTPERLRWRYGDMDYDWEHRVNTTSGAVGWRERLMGIFHSPYQPTDPALFAEMMASLPIDFSQFTFIDLGSGKGRTLLMASEYPFRKIIGVELLPALHKIAEENLTLYQSGSRKCFAVEAICGDAASFAFPEEPIVLYLFNPLPELGLQEVIENLQRDPREYPRAVYVLYHNPLLEYVLRGNSFWKKIGGTSQYVLYTSCR